MPPRAAAELDALLVQARQASRHNAFGPHLRESPLQEGKQARLKMAFLQQQIDARGPALQVEVPGGFPQLTNERQAQPRTHAYLYSKERPLTSVRYRT
jgi:hypothetical protein